MYLAYFKLQKKRTKIFVIVYSDLACTKSQLIVDLQNKYLIDIGREDDIEIMTLEKACKGKSKQFKSIRHDA